MAKKKQFVTAAAAFAVAASAVAPAITADAASTTVRLSSDYVRGGDLNAALDKEYKGSEIHWYKSSIDMNKLGVFQTAKGFVKGKGIKVEKKLRVLNYAQEIKPESEFVFEQGVPVSGIRVQPVLFADGVVYNKPLFVAGFSTEKVGEFEGTLTYSNKAYGTVTKTVKYKVVASKVEFSEVKHEVKDDMLSVSADVKNLKEGEKVELVIFPGKDESKPLAPYTAEVKDGKVMVSAKDIPAGTHSFILRSGDVKTAATEFKVEEQAPKVESVSAINGTQLKVQFNKPVVSTELYDASTKVVKADTLSITPVGSASPVTAGNLKGSLSADGKTLTVTINSTTEVFEGTYAAALTKEKVALKENANKFIPAFTGTFTISDGTAPVFSGVSYDAGTATVTFNEPLASIGTVSLDGVALSSGYSAAGNELVLTGLTAGKTYTLAIAGAKDNAGNFINPNPTVITLNVPTDNVKPTVNVSSSNAKVTFEFSEELVAQDLAADSSADDHAKLTFGSEVVYLKATDLVAGSKTKYTIDASSLTAFTGSFLNTSVKVEGFKDKSGNTGEAYTKSLTLTKDTTAPKFVSASTKDDKIIVKFDEDASNVSLTAIDVKFTSPDNVVKTVSGATLGTVADKYDANNNGMIDGDEENYLVLPVTAVSLLNTAGTQLLAGTYEVSIAAGKVTDGTTATTAATTFTVNATASSQIGAVVEVVDGSTDQVASTPGSIDVKFNKSMDSSALVASNYKLAGVTLPSNAKLYFVGDKTLVRIELPEGYVTVNGDRLLEVSNVKDVDGNTLKAGENTDIVTLSENVKPVATKLNLVDSQTLTVDFSEALAALPTVSGVTVKVNGTKIDLAATGAFALDSTKKVVTIKADSATAFKLTDAITVEFSGTNIKDVAGNTVKDVVLSK